MKILVIDDEPSILEGLEMYLQSLGHEFVGAPNGAEGIERCDDSFDLVMSDRRMPGASGEEAVRRIKQKYPAIKAVLLTTGGLTDSARQVAVTAGADEIWFKPLGLEEIRMGLERLLPKRGRPPS